MSSPIQLLRKGVIVKGWLMGTGQAFTGQSDRIVQILLQQFFRRQLLLGDTDAALFQLHENGPRQL